QFFAARPFADAMEMAQDYSRGQSELTGVTIDRPPSPVTIGGRTFARIDASGFGLFDSVFVTQIRCHLVTFTLTAKNAELRKTLVETMDRVGSAGAAGSGPHCIRKYGRPGNVVARVNTPALAPFETVSVRILLRTAR